MPEAPLLGLHKLVLPECSDRREAQRRPFVPLICVLA